MKEYIKQNALPLTIGILTGMWSLILIRVVEDTILKIAMIFAK